MRGCRKNAVGWNVSFFDTRCIWFHPCNKPQGLPAVGPLSPYMSYRHLTPRGRWLLGNLLSYFLRDRMSLFSLFLSLFLRRQRALFLTSPVPSSLPIEKWVPPVLLCQFSSPRANENRVVEISYGPWYPDSSLSSFFSSLGREMLFVGIQGFVYIYMWLLNEEKFL